MIRTWKDELFNRIKDSIGFYVSGDHCKWLRETFPGREHHHLFGSYTGLKTSDYGRLPVTREQHINAEKDKSGFAIDNLHNLISILIKRIRFLEQKLKEKKQ